MQRSDQNLLPILVVLAIGQLVGWGTVSLPAVIGEQLARDLGLTLPAVFAGTTVMLVVMGLTAPLIANSFVKYGARLVMAAGSLVAAPGFLLIAAATGPLLYYAGWVLLGIAGAAMLSTATYILLNEIAGIGARRPIGALMLVTGLASSLFWPITAALTGAFGWRTALVIYSAAMVLVCFPLHVFGLPAREKPPVSGQTAQTDRSHDRRSGPAAVRAAGRGDRLARIPLLGRGLDHHPIAQDDGRQRQLGASHRLAPGRHSGERAGARFLRRRAFERARDRAGGRDRHADRLPDPVAGRAGRLGHRRVHAALWRRHRRFGRRASDHAAGVFRCRCVRARVVAHRVANEFGRRRFAATSRCRADQLRQQCGPGRGARLQSGGVGAAVGARQHSPQADGVA